MESKQRKAKIESFRPGDMCLQLTSLANILDEIDLVYYNKESLFLDYRTLSIFNEIKFVEDNNAKVNLSHIPVTYNLTKGFDKKAYVRLCDSIYKQTEEINKNVFSETILIFITFDIEKRRWINQLDLLREIILLIKNKLEKEVVLVNNGMTQPINNKSLFYKLDQRSHEEKLLQKFCSDNNIMFISTYGLDYNQKISYVKSCDLAIGSLGTGTLLPNLLRIPTISAGNQYLHKACLDYGFSYEGNFEFIIPQHLTTDLNKEDLFVDKGYVDERQLLSYFTSRKAVPSILKFVEKMLTK